MKKKSDYFAINKKYLADGLAYLGFHYMQFIDDRYGLVYSFKDSKELRQAILDLNKLRKIYNNS